MVTIAADTGMVDTVTEAGATVEASDIDTVIEDVIEDKQF
jgi:hypothetical protein